MPPSRKGESSSRNTHPENNQDDLIVEKVVDQRMEDGQLKYLVKWKGVEQQTWETASMWVPYTTDLEFSSPISTGADAHEPPRSQARTRDASSGSKSPHQRAGTSAKRTPTKSRKRRRTVDEPPPPIERPPPFIWHGTLQYEVEKILESRAENGVTQYLIKWLGYDIAESTWENASDVFADDKVTQFYRNHPDAV